MPLHYVKERSNWVQDISVVFHFCDYNDDVWYDQIFSCLYNSHLFLNFDEGERMIYNVVLLVTRGVAGA